MKDKDCFELAVQGIPILFLLAYLLVPMELIGVSHTVLGKLIAIGLIILYSFKHIAYGFLVSILLVWYYQLEMERLWESPQSVWEGFDKSAYLPKPAQKQGKGKMEATVLQEDLTSYDKAYPDGLKEVVKENEAIFRHEHCKKGKLLYKSCEFKNENATHIFPEMKFSQSPCNPCDETCRFEVKKQQVEKILEPIESRGKGMFDSLKNMIPDSGNPFIGTGKEQGTLL